MSGSDMESGVRATLDAWRERGADRLNPVRFRFIEALERRAAGHNGEARRILDDRLSVLVEAYAQDLERTASCDTAAGPTVVASSLGNVPSARGALAELTAYIANHARTADDSTSRLHSYPELELLDYFREIWSKLSAESQLRQSLEQVPGNAGPLNSSSLVHRSLSLMRELSPGYLQQFLSYVDALSWMEQLNGDDTAASKDAPRAGSAKKGARAKHR
jgi:Protein of unknown function (DUF2894)